jgi:hypothetical protein
LQRFIGQSNDATQVDHADAAVDRLQDGAQRHRRLGGHAPLALLRGGQSRVVDAHREELCERAHRGRRLLVERARPPCSQQQRTDGTTVASAHREAEESTRGQMRWQWLARRGTIQEVGLERFAAALEQWRQYGRPRPQRMRQ